MKMTKKLICILLTLVMAFSLSVVSNDNVYAADSGVASINITTTDKNGNDIVKDDGYVSIDTITITDENGNTDVDRVSSGDQIKVRGNTTAGGKKKPFNIKFDKKTSVLGMTKNKKWCLLANCYDPTLLRNYIAFKMGQDMGLMVPDYKIVELTLDGVYKGCYMLTEATENCADVDTDKGEFFLEYERSKNEDEVTYFTSDGLRFSADDPEYDDLEDSSFTYNGVTYKEYIQNTLNGLTEALASEDYSKVEENFDVDSLAKFYLFNEFYKTLDIGYSSVNYVYRDNKLTAGPMWDYDLSSGNVSSTYEDYAPYYEDGNSYTGIWANKQLFAKLLNYDEFNNLVYDYYQQYKDLFADYSKDGGIIDQTAEQYNTVIEKNFSDAGWIINWKYAVFMRTPDSTYSANLDFFKNWLSSRSTWLFTSLLETQTEHTYDAVVTAPTCTEKGYTTHTCSCGDSYVDSYTDAVGHSWNSGKITTKATNTTKGVKTYTCSKCKQTKTSSLARTSSVTLYKGVNKTYKLTSNGTAKWKITSGKSYAKLKDSTLTVKKTGTVKVKDSKSGLTVTVTIKKPSISTKTSVTVTKGKTLKLTATATPNATVKYYVKAKKYKKYATVTSSGKVTAKKKGTCYIYAKANGVKKQIKVTVK